ncbi:MAG: oligosaccharide flippase family protein [Chlorobi bacterium]|nr:oligosaccharide flippase family protein [Chlorobiota bacterium]
MKVQENLGKISWSLADKVTIALYGVVTIFQMRALSTGDFGLFQLMIALHTWIFVVLDAFALQNLIQFGMKQSEVRRVNSLVLTFHIVAGLGAAAFVYLIRFNLADFFNEPDLILVAEAIPLLVLLFIPRTYCIKLIYRDQEFGSLFLVNLAFFLPMSVITAYLLINSSTLTFAQMINMYYIGAALSSVTAIALTFRKLKFGFGGMIEIWTMVKFGFPLAINNAFQNMPRLLDVYIVQFFFSKEIVGIYASAKVLFRVFDESLNAAHGLVYPSAVRQLANGDKSGMHSLMTKSVSFLFFLFLISVVILETGLSDFFISSFLPPRYELAIVQFNILLLAAIPMPFIILSSVILATGKSQTVAKISIVSVSVSLIVLYWVCSMGNPNFIPMGVVVYSWLYGGICYFYAQKYFDFKPKYIFRAFNDSLNFGKEFIQRRKRSD